MLFPSSGVRRVLPNSSSTASSKPLLAGSLLLKDANGKVVAKKSVYANKELIIGRDKTKCQWTVDDVQISRKHLRIYSVVYDADDPSEIDVLVYAEDLSQNGTFWNGSFIGKGNGGFLLSQDDCLKLSQNVFLSFRSHRNLDHHAYFDFIQEEEMKVGQPIPNIGEARNEQNFGASHCITDRLLGAGAFGRVFMAIEQKSRSQLACKIIDLRKLRPKNYVGRKEEPLAAEDVDNRLQLKKVRDLGEKQKKGNKLEDKLKVYFREVEILCNLNHPNIVGLEKVFITENTIYMFQDLVTAGDLFSYIEAKNGKLLEVEAAVVIRQILVALKHLHDNNIVHRDLKPDNILMTSLSAGCRIVLTDFGAARRIRKPLSRMSTAAGTDEYAAPEVFGKNKQISKAGYTKAVDLWSLGCVSVILLTGGSAFSDPKTGNYSERLAAECDLEYLRTRKEWQQVRSRPKSFVEKLLVLDEEKRMTALEALEHEWFSNDFHKTNFEELYQRTIRHWRSRTHKDNIVEFHDAWDIRSMDCLQNMMPEKKSRRLRGEHQPQEPHLKPFPRKMYSTLYPPRRYRQTLNSPEIRAAIEEHWSDLSDNETHGRTSFRKGNKSIPKPNAKSTPKPAKMSMGPPLLPARTPRFGNAASPSSQRTPMLARRTSFRVSAAVRRNTSPANESIPAKDKTPSRPESATSPFVSAYFDAAFPAKPITPTPANEQDHYLVAQASKPPAFEEDIVTSAGNDEKSPAEPPLGQDLSDRGPGDADQPETLFAQYKLRRPSPLSANVSAGKSAGKRRHGSVFDIHEDDANENSAEASPCVTKKQRMLARDEVGADARSAYSKEDAENEVTLPHRTARLEIEEGEHELYLPR